MLYVQELQPKLCEIECNITEQSSEDSNVTASNQSDLVNTIADVKTQAASNNNWNDEDMNDDINLEEIEVIPICTKCIRSTFIALRTG